MTSLVSRAYTHWSPEQTHTLPPLRAALDYSPPTGPGSGYCCGGLSITEEGHGGDGDSSSSGVTDQNPLKFPAKRALTQKAGDRLNRDRRGRGWGNKSSIADC